MLEVLVHGRNRGPGRTFLGIEKLSALQNFGMALAEKQGQCHRLRHGSCLLRLRHGACREAQAEPKRKPSRSRSALALAGSLAGSLAALSCAFKRYMLGEKFGFGAREAAHAERNSERIGAKSECARSA